MIKQLFELSQRLFSIMAKGTIDNATRNVRRDLLAAQLIAPYTSKYFPWTTGSLRPDCLITIINDIIINQRKYVVECGAGVSTLIIARVLQEYGGRLVSFEEDERWGKFLREALAKENLSEIVTIVDAPLTTTVLALGGEPWYDEEIVSNTLEKGIDLLVVDGPGVGSMRYPAGPFFMGYFADDFAVILDDIPRGAREFVGPWQEILQIRFRILNDFAWGSTNPEFKLFLSP